MAAFLDQTLTVPTLNEPARLDHFLAEHMPLSRQRIYRAIDEGGVYVNKGRYRKAGLMLRGKEKLRVVTLEDETLIPFEAEQLIWQQDHLYLIHKKSGQYAQEALHRCLGTLPVELAQHLNLRGEEAKSLRPVHRLDRDTSGLMLFSSDPKMLQHLQNLWHSHVEKYYLAVVSPAPSWDSKRITLPIGKRRDRQGRYHVDTKGRACDTEAMVIERRDNEALLKLTPHTGRTHQLRIHLSHLGHPILGDTRYGGKKHPRLMLHAQSLYVHVPALSENHEWHVDPEEDWQWR
jgi:23S rRNA pseudouridine1911/1915/1917 synthase